MKISTKGRYAIRMLLDLAEHSEDGFISLKDIAERQGVSKKYLEQIIPIFHKSDILITSRGFQGGYKLAKSPDNYTVGEILRLTEGSLCPVSCLENDPEGCERRKECATLPVWLARTEAVGGRFPSPGRDSNDKKYIKSISFVVTIKL